MHKITSYLMLDEQAKQLVDHVHGTEIGLTFSETAVLVLLLSSPNAIFTKEELLQVGWPDRVVAPTSLTQCISTLRKKLEPYTEVQLKTVARRGYQLHVSEQSHVKMLAINDADAIRDAIVGVSVWTKVAGIIMLGLLLTFVWYWSDHHAVVKHVAKWNADKYISLNIGGTLGTAQVLYIDDEEHLHPSWWQKHLAPEGNHINGLPYFSAFASTDGQNYSIAVCPALDAKDCTGKGIINITSIDAKPAGLSMAEFIPLSKKMEERIRYNRVVLPVDDKGVGELLEHNYHADIYFPVAGELLVRTDLSMSLVYEGQSRGKFYSTSCITDQDCLTTPIKYTIRGDFEQYQTQIGDLNVDVFHVKVSQKELTKPDEVSHSAMQFYRAIRKHDIRDEDLFYYRVYQNKDTAVWIVPQMGQLLAWTQYTQVKL
ncbi:winged helix-turn-helix domain-containing protein [Shewanella cutis]|uniref:Winged helix-turn-helix transcriptional regulator n=1 Tax=Shewanella cutis TaxID=2766780 RepID=A0ABS9QYI2_9GAMM|nr:winged helix-turn-helix domain-containing protein [Shewanella sp. PS-2]MCG9965426.1 winged helix-turn-helix transcriptional regulator [Shewanella sp. PS-2]